MDFTNIQDAIKEWLEVVSGLPAQWENETRKVQNRVTGLWILSPSSVVPLGQDYVVYTQDPDDSDQLIATVKGRREYTVIVKAISRNQLASKTSRSRMEDARISLKLPSILEHFQTAQMAIVRMGPTMTYDAPWDGRMESVATTEITFACGVDVTDTQPMGVIEQVELSSTLQGTDGVTLPVPPNLDDLLIAEDSTFFITVGGDQITVGGDPLVINA